MLGCALLALACACAAAALDAAPLDVVKEIPRLRLQAANGGWTITGALIEPRSGHTATLLLNGQVLIAGGNVGTTSAELFDPVRLSWTPTGPMNVGRFYHTATLLPNGKVLVAAGRNSDGGDIANAEIYDPASGRWSVTGSLNVPHAFHTATLLSTGEVVVIGAEFNSTVEIYDPNAETWRLAGSYGGPEGLTDVSMSLLANGTVLIAGGCCFGGVSLFDPFAQTFTTTATLTTLRQQHVSTVLPNGNVLVTGGQNQSFTDISNPERYDPSAGTWSAVAGDPNKGALRTAAMLSTGEVLVVGGADTGGVAIFDSATMQWSVAARLLQQRANHTATLLADGRVLVAGGGPNQAEVYRSDGPNEYGARPIITRVTPVAQGSRIGIEGNLFRGLSEASGGNASQNSPTNYPLVLLQSADGRHALYLPADPLAGWTDTTFTSIPLGDFPSGPATLTVVVNAIASAAQNVTVQMQAHSAVADARSATAIAAALMPGFRPA